APVPRNVLWRPRQDRDRPDAHHWLRDRRWSQCVRLDAAEGGLSLCLGWSAAVFAVRRAEVPRRVRTCYGETPCGSRRQWPAPPGGAVRGPVGGGSVVRLWMLGSGSRGNALVLESGGERLLVDAGFPARTLAQRMRSVGIDPVSVG